MEERNTFVTSQPNARNAGTNNLIKHRSDHRFNKLLWVAILIEESLEKVQFLIEILVARAKAKRAEYSGMYDSFLYRRRDEAEEAKT